MSHRKTRSKTAKWFAFGALSSLLIGIAQPARAQLEEALTADQIYNAYKDIIGILQIGDTTPEDKILAQLATIQGAMKALDSKLQALDQEVANLVYVEERARYIQMLQDVQQYEAQAQTASQQIREWKQTGKTDPNKLANAENNSQIAANTLMQPSYYMRPGQKAGDPDIFEYRTTLLPYLYALTVRLGVVAMEQPQFRKFSAYTDEFNNHVAWLKQIPARLEAEIQCRNGKQTDSGQYAIYSYCVDTLSGYVSAINGEYPTLLNPYITKWKLGSDADADSAFAYYTFYDRWRVQEQMGEHAVEKILPYVVHAATPWSVKEISSNTFGTSNRETGPLSNGGTGLCLDSKSWITDCNSTTLTQQWMAERGVAAPISATHPELGVDINGYAYSLPDACLEVFEWNPSYGVYFERCSGSSSEQWILSNANEIRWGPDPSLCLQNDGRWTGLYLRPCNGATDQIWYRTWPHYWFGPIVF
jgi:hypothetical protein